MAPRLLIYSVMLVVALGSESNLNGDYVLSATPNAPLTAEKFPTHFSDYPRKPSYFDVYSPTIKTLYSQVFWKSLPPVDIPDDIVKRFDGKGMAVVGFEVDQVRRTDHGDVSVPITVAYNHHFETTMIGKAARFQQQELQGPNDPRAHGSHGHGAPLNWRPGDAQWTVQEPEPVAGAIPNRQDFRGANGGEFRKSFHGYPPGFAQVVASPTQFQITPMQIDTWNREKMNISHPTRFVPGPVPRTSLAPTTGPDALYSGLLECPVTTRITKHVQSNAKMHIGGAPCESQVASGDECMEIAKSSLPKHRFASLQTSQEVGCFLAGDINEPDLVHVSFKAPRGREAFALHQELRGRRPTPESFCGSDAQRFVGNSNPLVNISVDLDVMNDVAKISLIGPKDVWFGVGFHALTMADSPWTIIVDGHGEVTERKLGNHQPGTLLKASVKIVESQVVGNSRSVILTRSLKGSSPDYYTFKPLDGGAGINFINAVGSSATLSYHQHRTTGILTLLPAGVSSGACLCKGAPIPFGDAKGTMEYTPSGTGDEGSGSVAFNNHCADQPRSDLRAMKNPTCDLRNYTGGQIACHHMWSLLDADQEIPWQDQPLEYSLKFRFWVEEYDETYHTMLRAATWGIASPVEYDVPKCQEGMMGCSLQNGTWIHTITGTFKGEGYLAAAHFHCHAPTCLSMKMYRCPPKTKVCNEKTGTLLCEERPRYGHEQDEFGETGYILQPPCLWGSKDFGLEEPPSVNGYVLGAVKTSNATHGHHGEMAWHQMYIFDKPTDQNYV